MDTTTTIIAILNSSFVLAVFALCAPQIGQCLNKICQCFGGPANNEQQKVLLNNGQQEVLLNNGQQEGQTNNGQEEGRTNNGQEGGQTNNGQQEVLLNNGQQEGQTNNGQEEGRTNNGQEGGQTNNGQQEVLLNNGQQEVLLNNGQQEGQTNNGQEEGRTNNGQEGGQTNNGQQEVLLNNGQQEGQTNNGQEGGQTNNGQQGGLLGPTNNDQPAGGEKTTGQSSSRNPENSSQIKNKGQSSGSHILFARALEIEHADKTKDTEYWEWIDDPREPRFREALKLKYVYLLDITAWMNFRVLTSKTNYAAYLIFRTTPDSVNLNTIQKAWVSVGGEEHKDGNDHDNVCIKPTEGRAYKGPIRLPVERDGWMELKLGEFYCDIANDVEVEITIKETNTARENTKTGLIVAAIEVRPA